jgi:hypothetical protein
MRGRSGKGKRDPETLKRESRRGYAGNQPRHEVADAPNGYFSGSLGKRVSKPTLSSSNDRSPAMCRFESCRPHHFATCNELVAQGQSIRLCYGARQACSSARNCFIAAGGSGAGSPFCKASSARGV